jgi:uncharacterized membrane protein YbhN (UPF0104 family)
MFSRLVRWLQPLVLCLAALAIAWFLRSHWAALRAYSWQIDTGWLVASALLLLLSWALEIAIWQHLLRLVGGGLRYWQAVRIWFLSAVVRYVPGNIWQPLSMTLYSRHYGVAPEATLTSIALYQAIILLAAAPMAAAYLLWAGHNSLAADLLAGVPPALAWLLLLPVAIFLFRPQLLTAAMNWALVRVGRTPLHARLTSHALLVLILAAILDWLLWGATFAAFVFGVTAVERVALAPVLVISYPLAYAAGFLSLITPSGFGVREGAFYVLLVPQIDGAVVTVVALAMRVWTTLGELLLAFISAPYEHARRAAARPSPSPPADHPADPPGDAEFHGNLT